MSSDKRSGGDDRKPPRGGKKPSGASEGDRRRGLGGDAPPRRGFRDREGGQDEAGQVRPVPNVPPVPLPSAVMVSAGRAASSRARAVRPRPVRRANPSAIATRVASAPSSRVLLSATARRVARLRAVPTASVKTRKVARRVRAASKVAVKAAPGSGAAIGPSVRAPIPSAKSARSEPAARKLKGDARVTGPSVPAVPTRPRTARGPFLLRAALRRTPREPAGASCPAQRREAHAAARGHRRQKGAGPQAVADPKQAPAAEGEFAGDRVAKVIARAGLGSRRDAEVWIEEGRVAVNGEVLTSAARNVTPADNVTVDGKPCPSASARACGSITSRAAW